MSPRKRKRPSSKKFKANHPRIVGKFYRASDSKGGHPVLVYYSDEVLNIYYVQRFSTKQRKGRKKLLHSIDPEMEDEQWLVSEPIIMNYDDMAYDSKFENYRIHPDDEAIVKKYQKHDLQNKNR